jgi:HK97 gp10 family phage protein
MGADRNSKYYAVTRAAIKAGQGVQANPADLRITEAEMRIAVNRIRALGDLATRRQKLGMLRKGATILRDAARNNAPVSKKPHKGRSGNVYMPGNLRESIQVKALRKTTDLFVGPRTKSSATASVFGIKIDRQKTSADGYYAHWVEYDVFYGTKKREGSAFMRRALNSVRQQVVNQIVKDATRLFDRLVKKAQQQKNAAA